MSCHYHKVSHPPDEECPKCKEQGIRVFSTEFDKQDRVIDTMRCIGAEFQPHRSRAILIFKMPKGKP